MLSKKSLDILENQRMASSVMKCSHWKPKSVKKKSQLSVLKHKALKSVSYEKLEEREDNTDMEVEAALPEKRAKKRKSKAGEMAQDEVHINAEKVYEMKVHNTILDTATIISYHPQMI